MSMSMNIHSQLLIQGGSQMQRAVNPTPFAFTAFTRCARLRSLPAAVGMGPPERCAGEARKVTGMVTNSHGSGFLEDGHERPRLGVCPIKRIHIHVGW